MLDAFWESVGGSLGDRWAAVAGPALTFWTGGLLAWIQAGPGWSRLADITGRLEGQSTGGQVVALVAALLVVLASALVVQRLRLPVLRALEGYWPRWTNRVRERLVTRVRDRADRDRRLYSELRGRREKLGGQPDAVTELAAADARLAELEMRARRRPPRADLMPTRTGNVLRAAERRPRTKYGLDAVIVWPHLWLTMPDVSRQELTAARAALDGAAASVAWGLAFCLFTPLAWWALPVGLAVAASATLWWTPHRAEVFADLVDAAYDLHRAEVYRAVRWPLPETTEEERTAGAHLTEYLWRGTEPPGGIRYTSS